MEFEENLDIKYREAELEIVRLSTEKSRLQKVGADLTEVNKKIAAAREVKTRYATMIDIKRLTNSLQKTEKKS